LGLAECRPCPNGMYTSEQMTRECKECEIGKYADGINSTQCKSCQLGTVSVTRSSTCSACVPGKYSSGAASACSSCPVGKHTRSNQADSKEKCVYTCRPGEFGEQGMSRVYNESCLLRHTFRLLIFLLAARNVRPENFPRPRALHVARIARRVSMLSVKIRAVLGARRELLQHLRVLQCVNCVPLASSLRVLRRRYASNANWARIRI
jgi:hypothetical protein